MTTASAAEQAGEDDFRLAISRDHHEATARARRLYNNVLSQNAYVAGWNRAKWSHEYPEAATGDRT